MKMKLVLKLMLTAIISGTLLFSGCSGSDEQKPSDSGQAKTEAGAVKDSQDDNNKAEQDQQDLQDQQNQQALAIEKWNTYVNLENAIFDFFYPAAELYTETYGEQMEFQNAKNGQTNTTYSGRLIFNEKMPIHGAGLKSPSEKILGFDAQAPQSELDQAALAIAKPMAEFWENFVAMHNYIDNKDYLEDDSAKAKEMHPKIVAASKELQTLLPDFHVRMKSENDSRRKAELEKMIKAGLRVTPAMLTTVISGEDVVSYLNQNNITRATLQDLNMNEYRALYDIFAKDAAALESLAEDEEVVKSERLQLTNVKSYARSVREVKKSAAELIEAYERKANFATNNEGSPDKLINEYGRMIQNYNSAIRPSSF